MSIRSGKFAQQLPDDQHEKEKVHHKSSVVEDEKEKNDEDDVVIKGGREEEQLVFDDDEEEHTIFNFPDVHAPPTGIRPGHYPPLSTSAQAPKPLSNSPLLGELKDRLKTKTSLPSFLMSPPSSSPRPGTGKVPGPAPTISAADKTSSTSNEKKGFHNEESSHRHSRSHQTHPTSSSSLVVCGVDGIVYTLDAYSGQLRGMFASGPALVFSSSPDNERDTDNDNDNDEGFDATNSMNGQGEGNSMNDNFLNGDSSNAITSNVSPSWKERVVPGLDGRLYSLFQKSDDTKTEVLEDNAKDFKNCQAADYAGEYDDLDEACKSPTPEPTSRDGTLSDSGVEVGSSSASSDVIPRTGTYNLTPLPINAMDVVDSPISTCRPTDGDSEQEQCGIIVGSKKTTIYAIDPATGKVQWTQDPMGGARGRGFTKTRPALNTASRGRTVLLQREDYAVKHLDTDGGDEVWKVELGRFSALDFDVDTGSRSRSGQDAGFEEDVFGGESVAGGDPVVGGRTRRGAAAAAASVGSKDKKKGTVPPILGGKKKTSLNDFDSVFGDDDRHHHACAGRKEKLFDHQEDDQFDHDHHPHFRGFPSIAFGEDGTSLMAVDGISGELLWKRRIDSVVAAVYGVGKESSWVSLDVIDEADVFTHGFTSLSQNKGQGASGLLSSSSLTPTSSPHSGGLVPYGAGQMESGKLHRLGRHHHNLFVSSKFDTSSGYDSLPEPVDDALLYAANLDTSLPPRLSDSRHELYPTDDRIFTIEPSEVTMGEVKRPPSHRTEHGLYLTWSMISAITMIALSLVIFVARIIVMRQKRKWENTPSLDPTTAPSPSGDGNRDRSPPGGMLLPPTAAQNVTVSSSGNIWPKRRHHPVVARSFSLDALGSHSMGSPRTNFIAQPFISEKNEAITPLPEHLSPARMPEKLNLVRGSSSPAAAATSVSPTITRSMTLPTEASLPGDNPNQQRPRLPSADNIDGIPLVRYSRYRSEFEEKSALGSGGFGTVFQCKNALDSREYAIKKIKIISQSSVDGTVTKHFSQKLHRVLREVKILALLDHSNIVRYYTAWLEVDDGTESEDDEINNTTSSMFDTRKSHSIFSSSIFSGFGSNSRAAMQTSLGPTKNINQQRQSKGGFLGSYNPLGWNNFGSSFRLDESQSEASSSFGAQKMDVSRRFVAPCEEEEDEDLGFTWERSSENTRVEPSMSNAGSQSSRNLFKNTLKEDDDSQSSSESSSVDSEESNSEIPLASTSKSVSQSTKSDMKKTVKISEPKKNGDCEKKTIFTEGRHTLFIQMQLCSSQTLADFLANRLARGGASQSSSPQNKSYAVDIPFALRLFAQIANGVKYVHKQGLIHRDLKPQNCFIDDAGNVQVGDFGLSRSNASSITDIDENGKEVIADSAYGHDDSYVPPYNNGDAENTAGVGTRTYASPEQMRGSNYDASTDVYSLGLILFELCSPPMLTAMERYEEFGGITKGKFPTSWNSHVKSSFPTMHDLLVRMISDSAGERPSADEVSDHIDSLLQEYSVQSLDKSWGKKGALLLRVEGEEKEGILTNAMKIIKDAAPKATILQYGLRGQSSKAIMEFALEMNEDEKNAYVECISSRLQDNDMTVRRIRESLG